MTKNLGASVRARLKQHADAVKRAQWAAFIKKNGLDSLPLASAVERIKTEILRINDQ